MAYSVESGPERSPSSEEAELGTAGRDEWESQEALPMNPCVLWVISSMPGRRRRTL